MHFLFTMVQNKDLPLKQSGPSSLSWAYDIKDLHLCTTYEPYVVVCNTIWQGLVWKDTQITKPGRFGTNALYTWQGLTRWLPYTRNNVPNITFWYGMGYYVLYFSTQHNCRTCHAGHNLPKVNTIIEITEGVFTWKQNNHLGTHS